jgi:antitoxin HicB
MTRAGHSNPHIGSGFDDFLEEEGIAAEVAERAVREVIAHLVLDHMEQAKLTKTEMAARMHTSRQALDRLLDPEGGGLTLDTLERAASAVGKRVRISFDDVAA